MSVFTENNGLCIKLLGDRLAVSGKSIGNIIKPTDSQRLFLTELFNLILSGLHTADNITLSEVEVTLIVELSCIIESESSFLHSQEV